ncbi:MAG: hypothetical protein TREMPRED_001661 [Tremellales sp. Tagirdzhanova-0007]|nr:MAG: hypothetical protein TREMPRED_001661 [Tremellales sp. Tagirdzhanova-0007]
MTAGAGAGLVSSFVTCPLDVVKTRLQAQHTSRDNKHYEGARLTVARIWRQAGFKGFYRGLGPTVTGYLPTWGIYFTVYDLVKDRFGSYARDGAHPQMEATAVHILAAMTAGATGTMMTNPLWVVKTRFMAQAILPSSSARYRHTVDAIYTIYRTEGFRAFYKGFLPSLIGVSHVAVQFPLYEKAKAWSDRGGDQSPLPPSTILVCSASSKMIASLVTYPHEVLRTRLQIRHSDTAPSRSPTLAPPSHVTTSIHLYSPLVTGSNPPSRVLSSEAAPLVTAAKRSVWARRKDGVIDTFLEIKRQNGWKGFYRGLSINLVRTVPNSAVTMLTYELVMRSLSES